MLRYFVTGAGGFLGGHMALRLARAGHEVFCPWHKSPPPEHPNIRAFSGTLDAALNWRPHLPDQLDGVAHFAAALPGRGDAVEQVRTNALGTARLLELCKKCGSPRVVYASTLYLAGDGPDIADDAPLRIAHPYYIAKHAGEWLCAAYTKETGSPHVALRISSPYGRNMAREAVIRIFIEQALDKNRIFVYNNGLKIQNYIYVEDVLDGFELALHQGSGNYNLCAQEGTSVKALAQCIATLCGPATTVVHIPGPDNDDDVRWLPSTRKIREELGFRPRYDLQTGCCETFRWLKQKKEHNHG